MADGTYESALSLKSMGQSSLEDTPTDRRQDELSGCSMAAADGYTTMTRLDADQTPTIPPRVPPTEEEFGGRNATDAAEIAETRLSTRPIPRAGMDYAQAIQTQISEKTFEKNQRKKCMKFMFIATIMLLLVSIALFASSVIFKSFRQSDNGESMEQLKQEIWSLQDENQNLTFDVAEVESALKKQQNKDNVTDENLDELKHTVKKLNNTLKELTKDTEDAKEAISYLEQRNQRVVSFIVKKWSVSLKKFCSNHSGILFNGTCVWEEKRPENMTLVNAYRKCNSVTPSKLPEFYNEEQYNQLMNFLRSKIPRGETYISAWIGLTRNYWTGKAHLPNGKPAPFLKLRPDSQYWLDGSITKTNAYLYGKTSPLSSYNGIGATHPEYTFENNIATVLCQTIPLLSQPKFKSTEDEVWCKNIGGIAYNGSCLWAEDAPDVLTLSTALKTCNERTHSRLPEVYGGQEFIEIMEYMRTKIKTTRLLTWTAMTRNIATNQAMLSDGTPAPYTTPRSSDDKWINATKRRTNVYLIATVDTKKTDQGMGAIWPTYENSHQVVFCQKL